MLLLISVVLFILCVLCYLEYLCYYTRNARLFNKIPGPYKIPLFGNVFDFLEGPVAMFYMARHLGNRFKNIYSVQVGHKRILNVCNPDDAEIVMSSSKYITKSWVYHFIHPWLQQGLLTSKGEKWHQRRKILTPAFHFNILRQFCKTFNEQSQNLVEIIKSEKNQTIDVIPTITQFTINSICETAMGTQIKSTKDSSFESYKNAIYEVGHLIVERIVRVWIHSDLMFKMSPLYWKQKRLLSKLHNFTTSVIRQRRKEMESGDGLKIIHKEDVEDEYYIKSSKKRLAMLDLLLSAEAEGKIDESGIREEVDTFMFEGHDTTAMMLSFSLMALANHGDVQDKIREELNGIFLDSDRQPTMEDMINMKYLEMCIKECLRLYPSVPLISRHFEEEVQLTKYLIPADTICHIQIYDIHKDPTIYPSPDDFIPERFTLDNCSKRHPFAYIPFSAGPRNCIGQRFAMFELKSVISTLLRNFVLEPITRPENIVFSSDLILRSRDPIYVKFIPL